MILLNATMIFPALTLVAGTFAFLWTMDLDLLEKLLIISCFTLGIFFVIIILFLTLGLLCLLKTLVWKWMKPNAMMDVASEDQDESPLDLEAIPLEIEDDCDHEDFFDADDGLTEEMKDEEESFPAPTLEVDLDEDGEKENEIHVHIGDLIPQMKKGRIVKNKFIVKLPAEAIDLLREEKFLLKLKSMDGVRISEGCDLLFIEATNREAAETIYNHVDQEFLKAFTQKMKVLRSIMKAHSNLPGHQGDSDGDFRLYQLIYRNWTNLQAQQQPKFCFLLNDSQVGKAPQALHLLKKERYLKRKFAVFAEVYKSLVILDGPEERVRDAYNYIGQYLLE